MTKCKPGSCWVGLVHVNFGAQSTLEADLIREGSNVLKELDKFKYCPECSKLIDWARIEKDLKDYFDNLTLESEE